MFLSSAEGPFSVSVCEAQERPGVAWRIALDGHEYGAGSGRSAALLIVVRTARARRVCVAARVGDCYLALDRPERSAAW